MRLADPKPGFCSVCYAASPELRFVDCEVAHDGAPVLDRETGSIAILPWDGALASHDSLYICEPCWTQGRELLDLDARSVQHGNALRQLRETELKLEHWREYAKRLEATLQERPEAAPRARRQPRAKVAA